jgi:hypothetical protein
VNREQIAIRRRRQEALDSLEFERVRERALTERLEPLVRDAEAWRADELAFGRMGPENADTLRRIGFAMGPLPEPGRTQREQQIAEIVAQLEDCRERQRAFEEYAAALAEVEDDG